jgi:hypothetical protein
MSEDEKPTRLIEEAHVERDIGKVEEAAQQLDGVLTYLARGYRAGSREIELAKINLEQTVMWAVKGIIR